MTEWGWTSYRRTGWVKVGSEHRQYIGHFTRLDSLTSWTRATIRFWAHRPIIALRAICESGNDPIAYHNQNIN